jgi:hypothetical protein
MAAAMDLHLIDLPELRGHLDDEGRRQGLWIARLPDGELLVEVYVDGVVASRPTEGACAGSWLCSPP